jgi:hypothetical protein
MPGPGQVGRGWDLSRILDNYEQRINTLEKLARGAGTSAFLVDTPRWRSRLAADTSLTNATVTNLVYSTEGVAPEHDLGSPAFVSYSLVAGEPRFIFATAGLYLIRASAQWNGSATGTRKMFLLLNANTEAFSSIEDANAGAGGGIHTEITGLWPFDVGDYLRVAAWQNSGGNLSIIAAGSAENFEGSYLAIAPLGAYDVA